jgi:hypothetical protein
LRRSGSPPEATTASRYCPPYFLVGYLLFTGTGLAVIYTWDFDSASSSTIEAMHRVMISIVPTYGFLYREAESKLRCPL